MAERKSVKIDIKLPEASTVKADFDNIISKLKDNKDLKLNIDTKDAVSSIEKLTQAIEEMKKQCANFKGWDQYFNGDKVANETNKITKNVNKATESVKKTVNEINKLRGTYDDGSWNIGTGSKGFDELQARADQIIQTVDSLAKIKLHIDDNGQLESAVIQYTDKLGMAVSETMRWKDITDDAGEVINSIFTTVSLDATESQSAIDKSIDKIEELRAKSEEAANSRAKQDELAQNQAINKALEEQYQRRVAISEQITSMQSKLNSARNNELIDTSVIDTLQQKLNTINTDTPELEIKQLKETINNLTSSEPQIIRLQNAISKIENTINSTNNKYGDLVNSNNVTPKLQALEQELSKLKSMLEQTKATGEKINPSNLANNISQGANATRDFVSSVKDADGALKLANQDARSFGDAFKQMATKFGMVSIIYAAISKLRQAFRDGIEDVKELDSAVTTLKITMDNMSTYSIENLISKSQDLATNLAGTTDQVLKIVKVMANANETTETIMNKTKGATILSNLSGIDASDTAKIVLAAVNQFDDLSGSTEKDVMRVADSIVAVSRSLKMDFADGVQGLGEGLKEVGALANQTGLSVEQTLGMLSATAETTQEDIESVGNALKVIISRIIRQKDTEKVLNSYGIQIKDAMGNMKNYYELMGEIKAKFDTLSEAEQDKLANALGGARQLNIALASVQNLDRATELTNLALNSNGEAMKANEEYAASLEGRMNSLKNTVQIFWQDFISSSSMKALYTGLEGIVKILDSLTNKFGGASVGVGILSNAFIMLTKNPLSNFTKQVALGNKSLGELRLAFITTAQQEGILSAVTKTLGFAFDGTRLKAIALQAALSFGISLAISGVIALITHLIGKMNETSSSMDNCADQAKTLQNALDDIDGTKANLETYEKITTELEKQNLTQERRAELEQELQDVKQQITTNEDEYSSILKNTKLTEEEKLEIIKEQYNEKLRQKALDLQDNMPSQGDMQKKLDDMEMYAKQYNEIQNAINNSSDGVTADYEWEGRPIADLQATQGKLKANIEGLRAEIESYNGNIDQLTEANKRLGDSTIDLSKRNRIDLTDAINLSLGYIRKQTEGINDNSKAMQKNMDLKGSMTAEETDANLRQASEAYTEQIQKVAELKELLSNLQEKGLTSNIIGNSALKDYYGEIGAKINNIADLEQFLTDKIKEQTDVAQQSYNTMLANDTNFYNEKIKNNDIFEQAINSTINNLLGSSGQAYNIDLNNFASLQDLKNTLQNEFGTASGQFIDEFINIFAQAYTFDCSNYASEQEAKVGYQNTLLGAIAQWASKYVGVQASSYATDLRNFNNSAQAKARVLGDLNNVMNKLQDKYNELIANTRQMAEESGDPHFIANHAILYTAKRIREVSTAIGQANAIFSAYDAGYSGISGNFKGSKFSGGSSGSGAGSGSKGSSGSTSGKSDEEKAAEEYQKQREQMEQNADNKIKELRTKLIDALKKKYEELRDKEIAVIDKQIEDKQKELKRLQDGYADETERMTKLRAEYRLWENDTSATGAKMRKQLEEQIKESQLNIDIENLEKQKDEINNKYDVLTNQKNLSYEAENMINNSEKDSSYVEMVELLAQYSDDYQQEALEQGRTIISLVKDAVISLRIAMDFNRGNIDEYNEAYGSDNAWFGETYVQPAASDSQDFSTGRVRMLDSSAPIYVSPNGEANGTWADAGVYWWDTMYITNYKNGRVGLARSANGSTVGYIDNKYIQRFNTGGMYPDVGSKGILSILDSNELVLTKPETMQFLNILPILKDSIKFLQFQRKIFNILMKLSENGNIKHPDKPTAQITNNVNITQDETNFSKRKAEANLSKLFEKSLRDCGIKMIK